MTMQWIMFLILFNGQIVTNGEMYDKMEDCFTAREIAVERIGRPIIGYQVICVAGAGYEVDSGSSTN